MNTKYIKLSVTGLMAIMIIVACKKEDDNYPDQNHDNNKLMSIIHSMVNTIDSLKMSNDPDNDFAMMMREHHKGSVTMATIELREGKDSILHQISRKMIARKSKETITLDSFLVVHAKADDNANFNKRALEAMVKMNNNADLQLLTGDIDHDFARLMIPQRQGAIDISELQIRWGHSDGLKKLAEKIIENQKKEIKDLQDWLLKN